MAFKAVSKASPHFSIILFSELFFSFAFQGAELQTRSLLGGFCSFVLEQLLHLLLLYKLLGNYASRM